MIGVRDDNLLELLADEDTITKETLPIAREAEALPEHHENIVWDGELVGRVHVRQGDDSIRREV